MFLAVKLAGTSIKTSEGWELRDWVWTLNIESLLLGWISGLYTQASWVELSLLSCQVLGSSSSFLIFIVIIKSVALQQILLSGFLCLPSYPYIGCVHVHFLTMRICMPSYQHMQKLCIFIISANFFILSKLVIVLQLTLSINIILLIFSIFIHIRPLHLFYHMYDFPQANNCISTTIIGIFNSFSKSVL